MNRMIDTGIRPARHRINLTPIMDVVFILVIFFLLAAQFTEIRTRPLVLAADGNASATKQAKAPRELHVGRDTYRLDGQGVMPGGLRAALEAPDGRLLRIVTGADAPYQMLAGALDAASEAGIDRLAIVPETGGQRE